MPEEPNFQDILNKDAVKGSLNDLCACVDKDNLRDLFMVWVDKDGNFQWRAFGDLYRCLYWVDVAEAQLRQSIGRNLHGKSDLKRSEDG